MFEALYLTDDIRALWLAGIKAFWSTTIRELRCAGVEELQLIDIKALWSVDIKALWQTTIKESQLAGVEAL